MIIMNVSSTVLFCMMEDSVDCCPFRALAFLSPLCVDRCPQKYKIKAEGKTSVLDQPLFLCIWYMDFFLLL